MVQTPYSQLGEAPSKREWHDTHRTWSSYEAWERPSAGAPPTQASLHHGWGSALPGAKGGGQMVNWKLGLRLSWIVATGCWVVGLPLYVYRPGQPPRRLLEDYGDDVVLFWMVAGPILLLLVGRLVVWATRGFPQRIDPPANETPGSGRGFFLWAPIGGRLPRMELTYPKKPEPLHTYLAS